MVVSDRKLAADQIFSRWHHLPGQQDGRHVAVFTARCSGFVSADGIHRVAKAGNPPGIDDDLGLFRNRRRLQTLSSQDSAGNGCQEGDQRQHPCQQRGLTRPAICHAVQLTECMADWLALLASKLRLAPSTTLWLASLLQKPPDLCIKSAVTAGLGVLVLVLGPRVRPQ